MFIIKNLSSYPFGYGLSNRFGDGQVIRYSDGNGYSMNSSDLIRKFKCIE